MMRNCSTLSFSSRQQKFFLINVSAIFLVFSLPAYLLMEEQLFGRRNVHAMNEINVQQYEEVVMDDQTSFLVIPKLRRVTKTLFICCFSLVKQFFKQMANFMRFPLMVDNVVKKWPSIHGNFEGIWNWQVIKNPTSFSWKLATLCEEDIQNVSIFGKAPFYSKRH